MSVLRSLGAVLVLFLLLAGCGTDEASDAESSQEIRLVYVSWVEGIGMTHVAQVLLEDSLGYETDVTEVGGAAVAFTAVAKKDADVFLDAWLPTTHRALWEEHGDALTRLGTAYDSTTVGLAVPTYTSIEHVRDLGTIREALDEKVIGIEAGAAINEQTRQVLSDYDLDDTFRVVPSSGAAMTSTLQRAISNREPVVVTAWYPHWMWGRFDLRYLDGAQTGDTDVFGAPENIYKLARADAEAALPADVQALFRAMHFPPEPMQALVGGFDPEQVDDYPAAARTWIQNHPDLVRSWLEVSDG